jgi:hypothetical protein
MTHGQGFIWPLPSEALLVRGRADGLSEMFMNGYTKVTYRKLRFRQMMMSKGRKSHF